MGMIVLEGSGASVFLNISYQEYRKKNYNLSEMLNNKQLEDL